MKTKEQPFDPQAPMYLEAFIPGQDEPFIVNGVPEVLIELHEADKARVADYKPQTQKLASPVIKAATASPAQPEQVVYVEPSRRERIAQYFNDAPLRRFDKLHGTHMYEAMLVKREAEAQFLVASQYGLIGQDGSLFYKRQLKKLVRGVVS